MTLYSRSWNMMIPELEELTAKIRQILPESGTIKQFRPDEAGRYVAFFWSGREFLVKTNMEVFELKNQKVFHTGYSMLIQSALSSKSKNQRVLEACAESLRQAEGLLKGEAQVENGLKLVTVVKGTIARMARSKSTHSKAKSGASA